MSKLSSATSIYGDLLKMSYQGWRSDRNGWRELAFCTKEELDTFVAYIKNRWGAMKPEEVYGKESRSEWYESPGMWMTIDFNNQDNSCEYIGIGSEDIPDGSFGCNLAVDSASAWEATDIISIVENAF